MFKEISSGVRVGFLKPSGHLGFLTLDLLKEGFLSPSECVAGNGKPGV